jgi:CHAT domain-containing protein
LRDQPTLTKAEAIQVAQLQLMHRTIAAAHKVSGDHRGDVENHGSVDEGSQCQADSAQPHAHPYYWAPFVLMGNWQ